MTLAQCRINDSGCRVSLELAQRIVAQTSGQRGKAPPAGNTASDGKDSAKPLDSPKN